MLQVLFDFIMTCLSTASDNGYQSIAFPAVGTGDFNKYPHHIVASIIFKAVAAFERQNVGSLTEVFCVVLNQDVKSAQIFRIQNKTLYQQYEAKKDQIINKTQVTRMNRGHYGMEQQLTSYCSSAPHIKTYVHIFC
ncbi:hypothetical protein KUTeg_005594 [Tegillarca granosa]|uniref:Macro domain-containing protein n=1 Tax=Tegillarca granosa TaxID=220873 RepID=A0ABQ9FK85_TEGGR|nr:hypothetical protein KUTeg_005594 [Tegillarca granosa]